MNWDKVDAWINEANNEKQISEIEPIWSFDCGLKLDYDGGLLRVSSRFYQVNDDIYDGSVSFLIGDDELFNHEFSGKHIDVLKDKVEEYVISVTENFKQLCSDNLSVFVKSK